MAEIREYNGRPAIYINGEYFPPMMATIRTNAYDHMEIDRNYYRELGRAGIRIFFVICDTVWLKPNALELFCEEAEIILEEVPDAYIIPRIGLHPNNEWIKDHPDDCVRYSDGTSPEVNLFTESYVTTLPAHYSLCSESWRLDAGKALAETWEMIMALPYADRIAGCFLAAGGTSEWYYMLNTVDWDKQISLDHSPAFKKNFSRFLREKYKTDAELQKCWKNPDATIDNPPIPETAKHYFAIMSDNDVLYPKTEIVANSNVSAPDGNGTSIGNIIDLNKNPDVYDFYLAWHQGTAESVLHFAKIIKELTPDKLVGAFYGAMGCTTFLPTGTCGATTTILNSPYIDFLAVPGVYENRMAGGFEGQREVQDSFALHNKMYIVEQDTRTHMENAYFRNVFGIFDLEDSTNIMKREFGRNIAEDTQAWWFDQILSGKRYKHPELYKLLSKQQEIAKESYTIPRTKNSEIAFIYDDHSTLLVSIKTSFDIIELLHNYEVARVGAPIDRYFHNDLADPKMPDYKMYVFVNTFNLTDDDRRVIREKLRRNNAVAVWLYASGVANPDREDKLSPDNIADLVGAPIEMDTDCVSGKFRIIPNSHGVVHTMQPRFLYGYFDSGRKHSLGGIVTEKPSYMFPAFYPESGTVAASFVNNGKPALTVVKADGYTSVFHGSRILRHDTIRSIARFAGCHIYCDSDDITYIGPSYITVHASTNGEKTLRFPKECTLREVYEDKIYAENVTELKLNMTLGETKTFRIY